MLFRSHALGQVGERLAHLAVETDQWAPVGLDQLGEDHEEHEAETCPGQRDQAGTFGHGGKYAVLPGRCLQIALPT